MCSDNTDNTALSLFNYSWLIPGQFSVLERIHAHSCYLFQFIINLPLLVYILIFLINFCLFNKERSHNFLQVSSIAVFNIPNLRQRGRPSPSYINSYIVTTISHLTQNDLTLTPTRLHMSHIDFTLISNSINDLNNLITKIIFLPQFTTGLCSICDFFRCNKFS